MRPRRAARGVGAASLSVTSGGPARLRDDRQFVLFWTARVVTLAGTAVTIVALPVIVYGLTGSPLLTGAVAAFEALPYLVFGLLAGALADRWDRKRVMVAADALSAVVLVTLPLAYLLDALSVGHVMAVAFVVPALFVFFDAADFGALPRLVGRERIASANSALWSSGTLVEIAVPPLAGALLAVIAAPVLLLVDAISYAVSAVLTALIRRPLSDPDRRLAPLSVRALGTEVAEGLRWLWRHLAVRSMTLVGAAQAAAGGAFVGQLVVWADQVLGVRAGDVRLGVVFGSWSVGALLATLALPRLANRHGAARVALCALPASAGLAVLLALSTHWAVAYMLVVVNAITYRQQVTPDALMSRVNTTGRMLSFGLGWPVGSVLGGVVSEYQGPRAAMLAGATVLVAGAVAAWLSPLRRETHVVPGPVAP